MQAGVTQNLRWQESLQSLCVSLADRISMRGKKIIKVSFIILFNFNNSDDTLGDQTGKNIFHEIPHEFPPLA
jgi:predicted Zn-dependent protease with MMP-like domain